ncbi:MAG: VCBS repeat-containing protein, partial [Planctomycetota bacterium]
MLEELREIRAATGETISWLGDAKALELRQQLALAQPSLSPAQENVLRSELADLELRLGNELETIKQLTECQSLLERMRNEGSGGEADRLANDLDFMLGVAHMRLGETQNCCNRNTPDSCVVPIRGGGIHTNVYGSTEAIRWFERVLGRGPERSTIWLRALWLYNIAHMTLGQYPDQVPEQWRLPQQAFESGESFPVFPNVAQSKKLDTFSLAGGAIADDFDGDGQLDLVVSSLDTGGQIRFFRNQQPDFVDCTNNAGLTGLLGGLNLVQADYDNDGFLDILVLRGGWFQAGGRHPKSLLHNNGDGTFTDITFSANIQSRAPTQTASWADYDNDGDLDLYIGNETTRSVPIYAQLHRNNADGTFTDVADQAGVLNHRFAKAVVWGDYDNDRLPDLYVSNFGQPNRLYHNQGNGTFVDVAEALQVTGPLRSFPAWFWDFDNDGVLDLYVSSYADDVAWLAAYFLKVQPTDPAYKIEASALYHGNGSGGFENESERRQLTAPTAPMGSNFGDLDNDGFLDFYLGTGEPEYRNLMPNVMYHNQQGERFSDVTMAGRFGHLQKGHAVVFADLDRDGDQDVFEQLGGAFPGDGFYDALFENPGFGNNWIGIS